jgi:hypothetical protein
MKKIIKKYSAIVIHCCLIATNFTRIRIGIRLFPIIFVVIVNTMEGCYNDEHIVAEYEVSLALTYLNLNNPSLTITRPTNELSNQQMARRCLLSKWYNKKHHFVYSINQKLSILQENETI